MKLRDLYEDTTCMVARYYKEASPDFDEQHNPEANENSEKNKHYYSKHFDGKSTPIFDKPATHDEPTTTKPTYNGRNYISLLTSPGYAGLQRAKARCGHPYDKKALG